MKLQWVYTGESVNSESGLIYGKLYDAETPFDPRLEMPIYWYLNDNGRRVLVYHYNLTPLKCFRSDKLEELLKN